METVSKLLAEPSPGRAAEEQDLSPARTPLTAYPDWAAEEQDRSPLPDTETEYALGKYEEK